MRGEVLGIERRRRWNDDDKVGILASVGVDGATVTQVANRHDVTRQQIYAWRHDLKKKGLWPVDRGAVFLPVDFPIPEAAPMTEPDAPISVELCLGNGRCLRFDTAVDEVTLTKLIRAVEAA